MLFRQLLKQLTSPQRFKPSPKVTNHKLSAKFVKAKFSYLKYLGEGENYLYELCVSLSFTTTSFSAEAETGTCKKRFVWGSDQGTRMGIRKMLNWETGRM